METIRAWLYDGETAVRHEVQLSAAANALALRYADGDTSEIPTEKLRHAQSREHSEIYAHAEAPGWRLQIPSPPPPGLAALLPPPRRYGRWVDRIGIVPAAIGFAAISASVIFVANRFPSWAAPYLPQAIEREFGESMVTPLQPLVCNGPGGQEALDKLVGQLTPDAGRLQVRVLNIGLVNAAALPGGHVLVFQGLLDISAGPDQVAGVLAHEIAHVEERHVAESLIRSFTFGIFVSMIGGNTGANIETVLQSGYSRGAEQEADEVAVERLRRANISPLGAADFFAWVHDQEAELGAISRGLSYISTHPNPEGREQMFRQAARGRSGFRPALTEAEWEALANICYGDPAQQQY